MSHTFTFPFVRLIFETQSDQTTGALFVVFFHFLLLDNLTYSPWNGTGTLKENREVSTKKSNGIIIRY